MVWLLLSLHGREKMLPDTLSDLTSLIAILNPQERQSDLFPLGHTVVDEEVGCPFSEKAELGPVTFKPAALLSPHPYGVSEHHMGRGRTSYPSRI